MDSKQPGFHPVASGDGFATALSQPLRDMASLWIVRRYAELSITVVKQVPLHPVGAGER